MSDFGAINDKVRLKLTSYMKSTELSASDVSIKTGLSLNTVKSFLSAKPMSSDSFIKLCKLGSEFTALLGKESDEQQTFQTGFKTVYCDGHGNIRKKCRASQSVWNQDSQTYDCYRAFGFIRKKDGNSEHISLEQCPRPCNYKEMARAEKQYEFKLRGKVKYISAKKGSTK